MLARRPDAEVLRSHSDETSAANIDPPPARLAAAYTRHQAARLLPAQRNYAAKRLFDIVFSAAVLAITLPLYPLVMLAIRLSSPGPALFSHVRIGKDGRPFTAYKFRTMRHDATGQNQSLQVHIVERWMAAAPLEIGALTDSQGHVNVVSYAHSDRCVDGQGAAPHASTDRLLRWRSRADPSCAYKLAHDPRITRVGHFLRKTSVDELPQFLNVLRGDMSVVGPRPSLVCEVDRYCERDLARLRVTPGITGIWQVRGRGRVSFAEMVEMDLEYVTTGSFSGDIGIILRTIPAVLSGRGAA